MKNKKVIRCPGCDKKMNIPAGKHVRFACPGCGEGLEYNDSEIAYKRVGYVQEEDRDESSLGDHIIGFLSHLVSFPIFIVLHKLLPDADWDFHADRILLLIGTLVCVELIFNSIRVLVIVGFTISFLWLTYGSFWGNYGFVSLYKDYRHMIYSLVNSPRPEEIVVSQLQVFPNKAEITNAIDFTNPDVRNFALSATTKHFRDAQDDDSDYRTLIQCFAVFKEINSRWNYVSDPQGQEYFAKASESVRHLSGDCDDHTILMAACIRAIGGTARLVHTTGHLYPELFVGTKSDMESINYLVRRELFYDESRDEKLHYHIDEYGQVWLNLDYTAQYPGGRFMSDELLGTLTLN